MPHDGRCCSETEGKMAAERDGVGAWSADDGVEALYGWSKSEEGTFDVKVQRAHPVKKPPRAAFDTARMRVAPAGGAEEKDGAKGLNEEVRDATRAD
jgi:hypothetical protein